MGIFRSSERALAEAIGALSSTNPFLEDRVRAERAALGDEFVPGKRVWAVEANLLGDNPNLARLQARAEALASRARVFARVSRDCWSRQSACASCRSWSICA